MALSSGARLGQYEITEAIGAGGMGEVYRARDTKLGREIAIKTLPEELSQDAERLSRFEREARLLAQLNHNNIATLHGLEEFEGRKFLVMELVEGETLGERIGKGAVPFDEALPLFMQIAEGLEAAHEKGIIHRDLKPANIKITPDGKVKILDFGLAKAMSGDPVKSELSESPTITRNATGTGAILGTAAYMSPEQARGKTVDKRTDIWAFGCCLFETLTGRKPFDADNVTDVLAAVVRAEPDWDALPPNARALVMRCLNKDPRERLRDIGDGRIELDRLRDGREAETPMASERSSRRIAVVVISLIVGLAAGLLLNDDLPRPNVRRLDVRMPVPRILGVPVISPDGSMIVFRSGNRLYSRKLDEAQAEPISGAVSPGPVGRNPPFFSPDGQWLGFFVSSEIYKVSIHGGAAVHIVDTGLAGSATWGDDDYIYFSSKGGRGISRISAEGGAPEALSEPDRGTSTHIHPEVLPNATAILYVVLGPDNQPSHIEAFSLDTGESKLVVREATMPRVSPTGHLLFEQNGNLVAAPFDSKRLELTGPQVTVVEGVARVLRYYGYFSAFSFSNTGELVYRRGATEAGRDAVWVDRDGSEYPTGITPGEYLAPTLSPDGRLLCLNEGGQLWVHDLESQTRVRVTQIGVSFQGVWTPDGKTLIFSSIRDGQLNLHLQPVDGSGPAEALTTSEFVQWPNNVTSNGRLSFFQDGGLWTLDLETMEPAELFLDAPQHTEAYGKLSPDGKWMAYASDETGRFEVYIRPFPGPDPRQAISIEGGEQPRWSRDGRELFYLNADRGVMVVDVETEPEFRISNRRELFRGLYQFPGGLDYDVAPDGRFIMLKDAVDALHPAELVFVEGWFEELKRLVPTDN